MSVDGEASAPFCARIPVRFSDVDPAGIVYYPRLLHYLHVAFEDFFNVHLGLPYAEILGGGVGFPAVRVETDFSAPLRFGEIAVVEVSVERVGKKSATFGYVVWREGSEQVCARAAVTVATVDLQRLEAVPIPPGLREQLEAYRVRCAEATSMAR